MELEERIVSKRRRDHRLIERPRLLRALTASSARVRMLVAPAGFGKSTLAEQWTAANGGGAVWFSCRKASADVAALAMGLAVAAANVVPGCDRRLRERLVVTQNPVAEVDVLAQILADDLAAWPADAWLVVDDYQFLCRTAAAELFMKLLVAEAPVNLLITSRRRPSWVSSRDILAGEVLEVNQGELAMSREEVELVLEEEAERAGITAGLTAITSGWPAVVALAAVSGVPQLPDEDTPEALYDFFAEEVYGALEPAVRIGLGLLAASSALDRQLADVLLGSARAGTTLAEGVAVGIVVERGEHFELHPLARTFAESKVVVEAPDEHAAAVASCMTVYRERRDWDSAFDLVERNDLIGELEGLLTDALDELLEAARLTTLEQWIEKAATASLERPIFPIAHAEVALRAGALVLAETLAEDAIRHTRFGTAMKFRSLRIAGQIAHVASHEERALALFRDAQAAADSPADVREAQWGQVMAMMALEMDEARALLDMLTDTLPSESPRERVRVADKQMVYGMRFGVLRRLDTIRGVEQLLPYVADPSVRCSFRSVYSFALVLGAYYSEALRVADDLAQDASSCRMDFGLSYAHATRSVALAGLYRFDEAQRAIDLSLREAQRCSDLFAEQNAYALQVRLHLQRREYARACALEPPDISEALPGMHGEVVGSRGLALACLGRFVEAEQLAVEAATVTRAVEAQVLAAAIRLVIALLGRAEDSMTLAGELVDVAFRTGGIDLLVTCYRACPEVLRLLLSLDETQERTLYVVARAHDEALSQAVGHSVHAVLDPITSLTRREREIYELMCLGMTHRAIAKQLFISEATVKLHAHRVYRKFGVRSRQALALNAANHRAYAAPATGSGSENAGNSDPSS